MSVLLVFITALLFACPASPCIVERHLRRTRNWFLKFNVKYAQKSCMLINDRVQCLYLGRNDLLFTLKQTPQMTTKVLGFEPCYLCLNWMYTVECSGTITTRRADSTISKDQSDISKEVLSVKNQLKIFKTRNLLWTRPSWSTDDTNCLAKFGKRYHFISSVVPQRILICTVVYHQDGTWGMYLPPKYSSCQVGSQLWMYLLPQHSFCQDGSNWMYLPPQHSSCQVGSQWWMYLPPQHSSCQGGSLWMYLPPQHSSCQGGSLWIYLQPQHSLCPARFTSVAFTLLLFQIIHKHFTF